MFQLITGFGVVRKQLLNVADTSRHCTQLIAIMRWNITQRFYESILHFQHQLTDRRQLPTVTNIYVNADLTISGTIKNDQRWRNFVFLVEPPRQRALSILLLLIWTLSSRWMPICLSLGTLPHWLPCTFWADWQSLCAPSPVPLWYGGLFSTSFLVGWMAKGRIIVFQPFASWSFSSSNL